ncbi:MAG: hypothetical protein PF447_07730, partial [Spirochaetaceae bacterium]|nr:hypothetical protein [Spirochaetaceae bacterium]
DNKDLHKLGLLEVMKKPMDRDKLLAVIQKHLPSEKKSTLYKTQDIITAKKRLGSEEELFQKLVQRFYRCLSQSPST